METARLRQFLVLCDTQNLRKADVLMPMSYPAFYQSLQVLHAEIRFPLYALMGITCESIPNLLNLSALLGG